ncbi:hypothetical protein E2C01_009936 [Portunus trituberculatus]|uniref:Uncharacterized protein n=1 Tax=Portunus trituberculatus TaxID=210409 RepID=A0A5B7D714_PORTR|nr:hypothetical protein [Portunus trituberculatus]
MTAGAGRPRAPRRPVVYYLDSSGQTRVLDSEFISRLFAQKHKFRFFLPLHRLFNSDNGSLLLSRLLHPPAAPQTPCGVLSPSSYIVDHSRVLQVLESAASRTHREHTK